MSPDFNTICANLQSEMQHLESQRLQLKAKGNRDGLIGGGICFGIGAIISLFFGFNWPGILVFLVIGLLIWYFSINSQSKVLSGIYKEDIIKTIISKLCEDSTFQPDNGISEQMFMASKLFATSPDRYHSEDLITGRIDKTKFACSEIIAEEKRVTTDSKGRTHTQWIDIFRGFFFIADFQKDFKGQTVVYRNSWLKFGNSGQRVKLENPQFEKSFDTYSTDQVEARYLLSPVLMEKLLELDQKFPGKITVSFFNSQVIVAIPDSKDHFETSIWQSQLRADAIRREFHTLNALVSIINDLNLNVRIWTKE